MPTTDGARRARAISTGTSRRSGSTRIELDRGGARRSSSSARRRRGWKMVTAREVSGGRVRRRGSSSRSSRELRRAGGEDVRRRRPADYGLTSRRRRPRSSGATPAIRRRGRRARSSSASTIPGTDIVAARVEGTQKVLFVPASVLAALRKNAGRLPEQGRLRGGSRPTSTRLEILRGRGRLVLRAQATGAGGWREPLAGPRRRRARSTGWRRALRRCASKEFLHGGQDLAALGPGPAALPRRRHGREGRRSRRSTSARRARTATRSTRAARGRSSRSTATIVEELSQGGRGVPRAARCSASTAATSTALEADVRNDAATRSTQKDGGWSSGGQPGARRRGRRRRSARCST